MRVGHMTTVRNRRAAYGVTSTVNKASLIPPFISPIWDEDGNGGFSLPTKLPLFHNLSMNQSVFMAICAKKKQIISALVVVVFQVC